MKRIGLLSVACAAMLAVACGGNARHDNDRANAANDNAAVGTAGTADANRRDVPRGAMKWAEDRMKDNMAEVKLGELAQQKAMNADVKAFGRQMIQDHTKANEELKQVAAKHNIQAPVEVDEHHRDMAEDLSKKQGRDFDKDYIKGMVDDHQKTLNALEDRLDKEGDNSNPRYTPKKADNPIDAELNQWAARTAPTIREHLDKAKQLNDRLDRMRTTNNNDR